MFKTCALPCAVWYGVTELIEEKWLAQINVSVIFWSLFYTHHNWRLAKYERHVTDKIAKGQAAALKELIWQIYSRLAI